MRGWRGKPLVDCYFSYIQVTYDLVLYFSLSSHHHFVEDRIGKARFDLQGFFQAIAVLASSWCYRQICPILISFLREADGSLSATPLFYLQLILQRASSLLSCLGHGYYNYTISINVLKGGYSLFLAE